jgi:anaerobic selenocysteine-containing dehydrogenase
MYHVGRPGEDGFTERVLAAWGVDGHNSHTNVCSSGGRTGFQFWCGIDRPSPDHANARTILLISSHLETGHYFNPHAQRIIEAKQNGAKLIVMDVRLSNTATHATEWLAPYPGSEPAILLSIARELIAQRRLRPRLRAALVELEAVPHRAAPRPARDLRDVRAGAAASSTPTTPSSSRAQESGVDVDVIRAVYDGGRRGRTRSWPCTRGARRPPGTRAAGRSRARCS